MKQPTPRLAVVEATEQSLKFRVWGVVRQRGSAASRGVAVAGVSAGASGGGRWRKTAAAGKKKDDGSRRR
jgi:hypothetical protein